MLSKKPACNNFRDSDKLGSSVEACAFHAKAAGAAGFCVSGFSCYFAKVPLAEALEGVEESDQCNAKGTGEFVLQYVCMKFVLSFI